MREETLKVGLKILEERDNDQKTLDKVEDALKRDDVYFEVEEGQGNNLGRGNSLLTITEGVIVRRALDHCAAYLRTKITLANQHIEELDDYENAR